MSAVERLPTRTLAALLIILLAVIAPHLPRLPPWLSAVVIVCGAWRFHIGWQGAALPNRWLRLALVATGAAGVFLHFGTVLGRDAGVAMLTLMTGLKLLEMHRRRDTLVLLYLAYFLIITQFLFSQSILTAGYMLAMVLATTVLLITVTRRTGQGLARAHLSTATAMVMQAVPIMLVLFLLFPRLAGPLWRMPDDAGRAVSGLAGDMSPGSVSEVTLSDAIAFRAWFDGPPPPPAQRYWRGPVLAAYNGRTWTRLLRPDTTRMAPLGEPLDYEVMLEAHGRHWLFALDLAAGAPAGAGFSPAWEMLSAEVVDERRRYRLRSYPEYRLEPRLGSAEREAFTALPLGAHPRTRALARELRAGGMAAAEYVRQALRWFLERPFVYTLTPPPLAGDVVDEFLFQTRSGFCEHFAGAYAVLMRAANVPARVVTGYLGGELSVDGNHLIVRQSDAHAWVEVWIGGRGWVRVDPTATVAPERIERGLAGAVPASDPLPLMARLDGGWLRLLRLQWEGLNARWNAWVLGYGPDLQQRFLAWLRLDDLYEAVAALALALAAVMAAGALIALTQARPAPPAPALAAWDRACTRLARLGLPRRPEEGPRDYAARVAAARPDLAPAIGRIAALYIQLRYEERSDPARLAALRRAVSALRRR